MRFYVDEDLTALVAQVLRRRGFDAESAQELGHHGWTDDQQLAYAASRGRTFVTRNVDDFIGIGHDAVVSRRPHAGIALFSGRVVGNEVSAMVEGLVRLAQLYPEGLGEYDVVYIRMSSGDQ